MKVSKFVYKININESFGYGDVTQENYDALSKKFSDIDFIKLSPASEVVGNSSYSVNVFSEEVSIVDEDKILKLSLSNIDFTVIEKIDLNIDITDQLVALAEKPIRLTQESVGDQYYNSKCEVHMPGMAMAMYNEMLLLEDCCTDVLQSKLNSGWRIIAACPQPDRRRPDYIMGRFNPNFDGDNDAKRD